MKSLPPPGNFNWPPTQWTDVGSAGAGADPEAARRSLDKLCRAYNRPILAVLRSMGFSPLEAEDVRQRFFLDVVVRRGLFGRADPGRGRVRDLLWCSLQRFVHSAHRDSSAAKRGGNEVHEDIAISEPPAAAGSSPDDLFEREWAHGILDRTYDRIEAECQVKGEEALWRELRPHLARWSGPESQISVAARLGISATKLSTNLSRLRDRFGRILHEIVSETAANPNDANADFHHLRRILSE